MSPRLSVLLDRYALVRRAIEAERQHERPNELRLVRLKRLQLLINDRIRSFVYARSIRRASAPRLSAYPPPYVYARSAPGGRVF